MPPDDTAHHRACNRHPKERETEPPKEQVQVLIPAAMQRRMAERVVALRDEISAFVAALPAAQEIRP